MTKIPIPVRVSVAYFVFGCLWILLSGALAENFSKGNIESLKYIEQIKGVAFVTFSALLIYLLSYRPYRRLTGIVKEYRLLIKKNKAIHFASKEGIYEFDFARNKVVFNKNLSHIIGADTLTAENARNFWKEGIHPDQRDRVVKAFDNAEQQGKEYWREEYLFKTKDGGYKNVLHSVYFIKGRNKRLDSMVGAVQDLTKHRTLEREYHEQQLRLKNELTRTIIKTEEKERNRWAEEMHDNIGQVLGVASLYTGMLKHPESKVSEMADKLKEMIDLSISEIRHLSSNLKQPRFEQGLKKAIENLVANIQRVNHQTDIQVSCDSDCILNEEQKLMIYRIVQEQINNTIKYAAATHISIVIRLLSSKAEVMISDNGKGFDTTKVRNGIGLKNIQNRLEVFQGNLEINSSPGRGCELRATFNTHAN